MTGPMWREPESLDIIRHTQTTCPHCRKVVNSAAPLGAPANTVPANGDIAFCFGCGKPAAYVIDALWVSLRELTDDELAECLRENARELDEVREFMARRGRRP